MSFRRTLLALWWISFGLAPSFDGQELDGVAAPRTPVVLEGIVAHADGSPAAGAVVVTSAGGKAVTGASGSYRSRSRCPPTQRGCGSPRSEEAAGASSRARAWR